MSDEKNDKETLLKFPCEYTVKIIGNSDQTFEAEAIRILRAHFPSLGEGAVAIKQSKQKNYLSLSATLWVESKSDLDALYEALSESPHTLFVL